MTKQDEPNRKILRALIRDLKKEYGYRRDDALVDFVGLCNAGASTYKHITRVAKEFPQIKKTLIAGDLDAKLRATALKLGGDRLYAEIERSRTDGLRAGTSVTRLGEQLSLALLEQTFAEAWETVEGEEQHAAGAAKAAAWDRYLVTQAEIRCRERGLDPSEVEMLLGDFISDDEARTMWQDWRRGRAA